MGIVNTASLSWVPCPRQGWRRRTMNTNTSFRPLCTASTASLRSEIHGSTVQIEGCRNYVSNLLLVKQERCIHSFFYPKSIFSNSFQTSRIFNNEPWHQASQLCTGRLGFRFKPEMCSILACYDPKGVLADNRESLMRDLSARMRSRGPDGSGYYGNEKFGLAHERLAIMDPEGGKQPIIYEDAKYSVCANGEIYNFRQLQTGSDSEVLLQLFRHKGPEFVKELNGIFGFVCVGDDGENVLAARDHCGIKPLYIGYGKGGCIWFASELKAICDQCDTIEEFPAGYYWTPVSGFVKYYRPDWDNDDYVGVKDTSHIREVLTKAVQEQMMSDVPIGLLLSGGLDSAVISTIIKPMLEETKQQFITFTVGQEGSPDITAARMMSEHLGTDHHEYLFTSEEACSVIPDVIYHLETYEPELIRSAIPNYFLARLASEHVKVVLTGEGSDELFAGYLYFRDAPDSAAIHKELRRIFHHLHNVNCQRADRMTMAHGLEARVPFLDPNVIDAVMQVNPELKRIEGENKPEKHALRALFNGEIPEPVLWRTKAMQCEGVGLNWVDDLQAFCSAQVTDEEFKQAKTSYTINPPQSKEEMYYRKIFESHYQNMDKFVHVWDGGCRAGGAAWQNQSYTRFGLKDVTQLAKGIEGVRGAE